MAKSMKLRKTKSFALFPLMGIILLSLLLVGCDASRNYLKHDRAANMEFQDFRDALEPRLEEEEDVQQDAFADASSIPELQSYVAPPSDSLRGMPLVSISVNQTVPLRDALFELAEQAGYDISLDPRIRGSIIFTARNRPFDLVIERISEIAGLRYEFDDDRLLVRVDTPFQKNYKVDYLAYIRSNAGSIKNDISVVSGEGADTGSSFEVTTESVSDFWEELNQNLTQILGITAGNLRTDIDPVITATAPNPAPVQPIIAQGADGQQQVQVQPPQAVLQVSSLPTGGLNSGEEATAMPASTFAMNRQAGIVSVYATERQHEEVREYLNLLKRSVTSQVLIEAKVLQVDLLDRFAAGIDWSVLRPFDTDASFGFESAGLPAFDINEATSNAFLTFINTSDIQAMVEAIATFGTVRALASPRMTVLNNQSAVLNVARNAVYFELDIQQTTAEGGATETTVDSQIKNVPEGVLINVQPSIDLDSRTVSMAIRPTITRIDQRIADPAVIFLAAEAGVDLPDSTVPEMIVQEMDSVISMNSGETIIMGGLMQDRTDSQEEGVPVLSELPVLGALFRTHEDTISKSELVVFLRATIIDSPDKTIFDADRDLYKRFSGDRRPLKL